MDATLGVTHARPVPACVDDFGMRSQTSLLCEVYVERMFPRIRRPFLTDYGLGASTSAGMSPPRCTVIEREFGYARSYSKGTERT